MSTSVRRPSRRDILKGLAAAAGGTAAGSSLWSGQALAESAKSPKFLIVLAAGGGMSIIDGPLAIRASECATPDTVNCFPDSWVKGWDGSPFRAADFSMNEMGPIPASFSVKPSEILARRRNDLMVATWTRTSVNHAIGQRRAITGNEAWKGRTLQELVAWQYGADVPIPNIQLLSGTGYSTPGTDASLPPWTRGQLVSNPATFPLSLDGAKGLARPLSPSVLEAVRKHRNSSFDPNTPFTKVFGAAPRLAAWNELRGTPQERIESLDLITRLMVQPDGGQFPLGDFGLDSSPAAQAVREVFPRYDIDPFHAQAALAFLLLKYRVSVSVTLGPTSDFVYDETATGGDNVLPLNSVLNPPLAFDSSHQGHRSGQAVMIEKIYAVIDGLIALLSKEDYGDGSSMWDHTMIYVATDFGREKHRPAGAEDWGTSHSLNNGVMVFSPMVPGDTLRGGVDPDTGFTYGFDPVSGAPEPGREMAEAEVFGGLLGALGVDTAGSGLPDVPAMRRV